MNAHHKWQKIIRKLHDEQLLTPTGRDYVSRVVSSPPSRNPGNATKRNLIAHFASRKMGHTIPVESATLEAAHAQLLECDQNCVGYWSQPEPLKILYTRNGEQRHDWLTFDFLVISQNGVELHECKPEAKCIELSQECPGRFKLGSDGWTAPEVEASLEAYGIGYRIITEKDVPPTLVRNIAILNEAPRGEYSSSTALGHIRDRINSEGISTALETVLSGVGTQYSKNDVYLALARRDIFTLLEHMLLVDIATTRVFVTEHSAEAYRLQHCVPKPSAGGPVLIRAGDKVLWHGAEHRVCNASKHHIYLQQKSGEPIKFAREFLFSLIETGEIVLPEAAGTSRSRFEGDCAQLVGQVASPSYDEAVKKLQFLSFLRISPKAKPEDFGLPRVSWRTIQRWRRQAAEGERRFGSAVLGLMGKPRRGNPRETQPPRARQIASEVADQLYFHEARRSQAYCWRAYRARCLEENLTPLSPKSFRRHIRKMRTAHDATEARKGARASYALSAGPSPADNWLTAGGDYPLKVAQMDGKFMDIEIIDEERHESLGRPYLTLIGLPHYGMAPIGRALLFEKANHRSSLMALRDCFSRFGRLPTFLITDNGKEFNNTAVDRVLALFGVTKVNRPPNRPRFSSEMEAFLRTMDRELTHNAEGNTQASRDGREMTAETDPKQRAVWTLPAFIAHVDKYLFDLSWDAPSAALGTTPRNAFARASARAPEAQELMLPPKLVDFAFLPPPTDHQTRQVQPGRGVWVEGWYYWNDRLSDPNIEKQHVEVRYDPYDLYCAYVLWKGESIKCVAKHAPELRNVTTENYPWLCLARRQLRKLHPRRREDTHGLKLAALAAQARANEQVARAARDEARREADAEVRPAPAKPGIPSVDLRHLRNAA